MEIKFLSSIRCKTRSEKYYQDRFRGFKAERIYISEFGPGSNRNGGFDARYFWSPATEFQAKNFAGDVFFKNASFYGCSRFYIKDRVCF